MVWLEENMAMALKIWKTAILARKFQKFAGRKHGSAPTMKKPALRRVPIGTANTDRSKPDQYL
jgi:hypothetical protein